MAADVRIWLLGQLFESEVCGGGREREREGEGERVSLSQLKPSPPKKHALNRKRIFSKNVQFAELAGKKERKKKKIWFLSDV